MKEAQKRMMAVKVRRVVGPMYARVMTMRFYRPEMLSSASDLETRESFPFLFYIFSPYTTFHVIPCHAMSCHIIPFIECNFLRYLAILFPILD